MIRRNSVFGLATSRLVTSCVVVSCAAFAATLLLSPASTEAANRTAIRGQYLETRTCQVYTGPCFANAEVGLAGKSAVMAWSIEEGTHSGVDLSGLSVVLALKSSKTLEFGGIEDAGELRSVVYVDDQASTTQQAALLDFVKQQTGRAGETVERVTSAPIAMSLDTGTLEGKLNVGKRDVRLETRKARPEDCICSNEAAYYPPLVAINNFVPGVATVGEFHGRGLGTRWSTPGARSVYMGTFAF